MLIKGKTVCVSGASRGIGLAVAKSLALQSANVILLGRNAETLCLARESLACSEGQRHDSFALDVSEAERWTEVFRQHSPDILVNVAGSSRDRSQSLEYKKPDSPELGITHYSLLARTPLATIDSLIATNLLGTIYGSRAASKSMLRKGGSIINVSSAMAHRGGSGSTVYAASKAGVIGFTKALAQELGPRGIRCNSIAPGYIETDMVSAMTSDMKIKVVEQIAARRIGTVEEVANAVLFLIENDYANGTTITLDGGLTYE